MKNSKKKIEKENYSKVIYQAYEDKPCNHNNTKKRRIPNTAYHECTCGKLIDIQN